MTYNASLFVNTTDEEIKLYCDGLILENTRELITEKRDLRMFKFKIHYNNQKQPTFEGIEHKYDYTNYLHALLRNWHTG